MQLWRPGCPTLQWTLHCDDDDDGDDEDGGTDNDNGEEEDEDDGDAGGESVSPQRLCEFCRTTIKLPSHMM